MSGADFPRAMQIKKLKEQGLNQKQIAAILGCTRANVTYFSRKYGLGDWTIGRPAVDAHNIQRLRANQACAVANKNFYLCERCQANSEEPLHIHHTDRDRNNNNISNLEILCNPCHGKEHLVDRQRDIKGRFL